MRVRVSDPSFTDALEQHLRAQSDMVVDRIADDELEVTVVASLDEQAMRMEIYLRIRAWEAEQDAVRVEVLPSAGAA